MNLPPQRVAVLRHTDCVRDPQLISTARLLPAGACGADWHEPLVPDRWGRADFTESCRSHDRCYDTCGRSKVDCDGAFHSDLRSACRNAYSNWLQRPQRRTCLELANTYYSAVHRMGGDAYRDAQQNSGCAH